MWLIESNISASALLNLLNLLIKKGKMLGKPCILSLFPNSINKFNETWALLILYKINIVISSMSTDKLSRYPA